MLQISIVTIQTTFTKIAHGQLEQNRDWIKIGLVNGLNLSITKLVLHVVPLLNLFPHSFTKHSTSVYLQSQFQPKFKKVTLIKWYNSCWLNVVFDVMKFSFQVLQLMIG